MAKKNSAHDIVAHAIVSCNVSVPIEFFLNLSPTDPLFKAVMDAWQEKERRADARTALLCAVMANCMGSGGKKYEAKDFMPQVAKSTEDSESEIKTNFMKLKLKKKV